MDQLPVADVGEKIGLHNGEFHNCITDWLSRPLTDFTRKQPNRSDHRAIPDKWEDRSPSLDIIVATGKFTAIADESPRYIGNY